MNGKRAKLMRKVAKSSSRNVADKFGYTAAQVGRLNNRMYKSLKKNNSKGGS